MEFPYRTDFLEVALADHPRAVVERRIAAGEKDGLLALAATGAEGGSSPESGKKTACWRSPLLGGRLAGIGEGDRVRGRNRRAESLASELLPPENPREWGVPENHVPGGLSGAGDDGCSGWPAAPFLCLSS